MKILEIKSFELPEVKSIKFAKFFDGRGYFTETFRWSDLRNAIPEFFTNNPLLLQVNESYSQANVVRGLHFQWKEPMGKLLRTVRGRMIDIFMDIRLGSPNFGKIMMHDMPASPESETGEWLWVPPGFAHGNFFTEQTQIEYFCTAEYNPACEAGISPLSKDLDWSYCNAQLKEEFDNVIKGKPLISEKDILATDLMGWAADERSKNFQFIG
jgi:dTDP-4-dehydrorhamnose 3,5-epimerase